MAAEANGELYAEQGLEYELRDDAPYGLDEYGLDEYGLDENGLVEYGLVAAYGDEADPQGEELEPEPEEDAENGEDPYEEEIGDPYIEAIACIDGYGLKVEAVPQGDAMYKNCDMDGDDPEDPYGE